MFVTAISVLFGCFTRKIDGTGLPGGLIIYQGHSFPLKGHLWSQRDSHAPKTCFALLRNRGGGHGFSHTSDFLSPKCLAIKA